MYAHAPGLQNIDQHPGPIAFRVRVEGQTGEDSAGASTDSSGSSATAARARTIGAAFHPADASAAAGTSAHRSGGGGDSAGTGRTRGPSPEKAASSGRAGRIAR